MTDGRTDLTNRIVSRTRTHARRVEECVSLVPDLLARYDADEDYREVVDRIRTLESACDRSGRRLCALVSNASVRDLGLRNARVHRNAPQVVDLYQRLDVIPDAAERIADELATVRPPRSEPCFRDLRAMAERATAAMAALGRAVTTFVQVLCTYSQTGTVAEEVESVRRAESACDDLRNGVVATAFEDESVDRPLVYRSFALRLDALVNAMEAVVDQMVLVGSSGSWITTGLDRERPVGASGDR